MSEGRSQGLAIVPGSSPAVACVRSLSSVHPPALAHQPATHTHTHTQSEKKPTPLETKQKQLQLVLMPSVLIVWVSMCVGWYSLRSLYSWCALPQFSHPTLKVLQQESAQCKPHYHHNYHLMK